MTPGSAALHWGIKASFRGYVSSIVDGAEVTRDGASAEHGVFAFAFVVTTGSEHRFRGRVDLTGYDGLLSVQIKDPWLHLGEDGQYLSIIDSSDKRPVPRRLTVCRLTEQTEPSMPEDTTVFAARLDATATRLFDDVYRAGAELDPITVTAPDVVARAWASRAI